MDFPHNDRKRRRPASDEPKASSNPEDASQKVAKKARVEERRSIFVRSLPPDVTNESLADFFSQYFPVKHATVIVDQKTKESRGFGFVTFADADDASNAQTSLDKKDWAGRKIRIDIAEPRKRSTENSITTERKVGKLFKQKEAFPQPPKLIIRNLPWSIKTSEQLAQLFTSFGKVKFSDLPKNKGKLKGFGFVTIRGRPNAEKAIEAINGKVVDGRTLAVDWAVDKQTWDQQNQDEEEAAEDALTQNEEGEGESNGDDDDEPSSSVDEGPETTSRDNELDADLANFMKNHMQNMEEEDDDDDDKNETFDKEAHLESDAEEEHTSKLKNSDEVSDNSSTVFIRNLPFNTSDEQLKSFFSHFGTIRYARVVFDKITDKPAGTGFVCFLKQADAKACIIDAPRRIQPTASVKHSVLQDENADPSGKYTLEGRLLQVVQAVGRQEATNLAENSLASKREKDKRKLYLLAEGAIPSNSPIYNLLTPAEVRMRQASAQQRKKLVQKNPLLHVSLTRLALRNMPRNVSTKDLKELARKAIVGFAKEVKEGRRQPLSKEENARDGKDAKEKERDRKLKRKGIVRQAKVVFEDNKGSKVSESSGAGKSRGYGFIEYTSHHWALMGLRYLNGLQLDGENGKKQRLIVEFAIENIQVVHRRQAAEEKAVSVKQASRTHAAEIEADMAGEKEEDILSRKEQRKDMRVKKSGKQILRGTDSDEKTETPKEAMQQKLIARKRLMRKKKAAARK